MSADMKGLAEEFAKLVSQSDGITLLVGQKYRERRSAIIEELGEFAYQWAPAILTALRSPSPTHDEGAFQKRVHAWMTECFGPTIAADMTERNHRFLEEALELVQASGCSQSEAHQLVDYVYGRPSGEDLQEVGGVMVTLAALCNARGIQLEMMAERELTRVWTKIEKIRAKQAAKPKHSPLPEAPTLATERDVEAVARAFEQQFGHIINDHGWAFEKIARAALAALKGLS